MTCPGKAPSKSALTLASVSVGECGFSDKHGAYRTLPGSTHGMRSDMVDAGRTPGDTGREAHGVVDGIVGTWQAVHARVGRCNYSGADTGMQVP